MFVSLNSLNIRWKFVLSSYCVMLVGVLLITGYVVYSIKSQATKDVASFRVEELDKKQQTLKNYIDIAYETIDANYQKTTDRQHLAQLYGRQLQSLVEAGHGIVQDYIVQVQQGRLTVEEAKRLASASIKRFHYDDGKGYIWINDTGRPYPKMVMHPTVPALDGTVLDNAKYNCALGRDENLFKAFVDVTEKQGAGFVDYLWPKPTKDGLTAKQPKLSYVRLIPEWGWIIGTGIYIDDAITDIIDNIKVAIKDMRYDDGSGYFWINTSGKPFPKMVMHPTVPDLDGAVLDNAKYNCALGKDENLFKAFVDVTEKQGEGFVGYL